ncbi:MAG TPA: glycerol-3-phosphate dehydrogenase/oxidase, partial [Bdellovibrionales bacterium]|nr:glycerol-3-phosphate dehydrogenase/oxidase [Bdellovibrionales bacterium]
EASDFASGTSSRSSKLIHGGIRYLENLEFGLVFEALTERQKLFEMAPHLVHPLRFVLPVYKSGRVPAWKMGIGMWIYDALSLFEAPELHTYMDSQELAQEFPELRTRDLSGGFAYYDAYMDDDRLVLETLRAADRLGARIANYVKAAGAEVVDGKMRAIVCEDQMSKKRFPLRAKHFVSSVGPWTDAVGEHLFKNWKRRLRPSKGVHLTFSRERFPLQDAVVMGAEKRIVFAIPRHEMVIVGTTDTDFASDPGQVHTDRADVKYLLKVIEDYFPGANIRAEDIVGCYAGVRPLIDDGSKTESKTSREHEIWTDPHGCTFVAGGKYTTYRNMAEQTVDFALQAYTFEDQVKFSRSNTETPLNPLVTESYLERARREAASWRQDADPRDLAWLAERHGMEAPELIRDAHRVAVAPGDPAWVWCVEALHAVERTMCLHLRDFYFRRTPLVLSRRDHGLAFVDAVADTMASRLAWTPEQRREEINALQKQIAWELQATSS